ncbi:MAG TPA: hypothetical protein P5081_11410 [Phycisphaerae bacterium]|nr:hypothetical protein [Phycisphaerae bacterium]HRW53488.1 hypothetical protein [Phycisphaerae bacterium]
MRPRSRQFIYILLAAAVLYGATTMVRPIEAARKEAHLVLPPAPDAGKMSTLYSPLLAVARAPIVDVLWLKATKSKEEGRIFDAYQLAELICELQPKFPDVWAFQAWNMAYNISVTCSAPEERWRWVRNGYEQLRDKGIPLNPNNTQLYRELSWILFHKVGDFMDDAHWYYKTQFALIAEHVLGVPPEGYVRPGRVRGDFYRSYDYPPLALMPERYDELFGDSIVKTLVERYRVTSLQPKEVVALLDMEKSGIEDYVKGLGREGLDATEIETLVDLLRVDLKACRAMIEELRREAADLESGGGIAGFLRRDEEAASFARELDRYGFDIAAPGVFSGLMNAMRTGKIKMPNTPRDDQDRKAREFLTYLRDPKHERVRNELQKLWGEQAGLDTAPILAAYREDIADLRRGVRAFRGLKASEVDGAAGDFGFDVSQKDVFLGMIKAIHDDNLAIPNVEVRLQDEGVADFLKVWNNEENAPAKRILEWFWRADRLRSDLKLDPMRVVHMHNGFDVIFDYRFAESHSLYWANLGTEIGTDKRSPVDIHKLNADRIEFYCLQKMYYRGRIAMSPEAGMGEPPLLSPDLRVVPVLIKAFHDASEPYLKEEFGGKTHRVSSNFQTGFVGFMRDAIVTYHERGYDEEARNIFDILRNEFPDPMYEDGIDGFLMKEVPEDRALGDYRVTVRRIQAMIRLAITQYAYNEDALAAQYIERAREIYKYYHKQMVAKRQAIPFTFEQMLQEAMDGYAFRWNRRETYLRVCQKLGVKPLPEGQPAKSGGPADQDDAS